MFGSQQGLHCGSICLVTTGQESVVNRCATSPHSIQISHPRRQGASCIIPIGVGWDIVRTIRKTFEKICKYWFKVVTVWRLIWGNDHLFCGFGARRSHLTLRWMSAQDSVGFRWGTIKGPYHANFSQVETQKFEPHWFYCLQWECNNLFCQECNKRYLSHHSLKLAWTYLKLDWNLPGANEFVGSDSVRSPVRHYGCVAGPLHVISHEWLSISSVWHKGCCYLIHLTSQQYTYLARMTYELLCMT